jgi:predicted helicase
VCVPNLASNSKLESNLPRLLDNIPAKAYDYAVNGKSAIEGIVERYQVKIDRIISDSADTSASCFAKNRKIFVK